VQAVSYGPVVLSGRYGASYAAASSGKASPASGTPLPVLDAASVRRTVAQPMTFGATADGTPITMGPVARAQHEHFTVYWQTAADDLMLPSADHQVPLSDLPGNAGN
jgi:uncharacterized protein